MARAAWRLAALLAALWVCPRPWSACAWVGDAPRARAAGSPGRGSDLERSARLARSSGAADRTQETIDDWKLQRLIKDSVDAREGMSGFLRTAATMLGLSALLFFGAPLVIGSEKVAAAEESQPAPSRAYTNLTGFPFPLGPFFERKTVMTELVAGKVYSFEQPQDLAGITANVRCTAFRMRDGRLAVYNPVAPTEEFLQQLKSVSEKGVAHILLGSTAYEHKVYTPSFSRAFPEAKVWAVPDQWSWPLDLPAPLLGLNATGELIDTSSAKDHYANAPELTSEFEVKVLRPQERLAFGYSAVEAAVFHKDTKVVAFTDALVNVPSAPTPVYGTGDLLAVGDKRPDSLTVGNLVLKAAGAVNWRGTAAQENAAFWSRVQADGPGSEQEQVQRGWELNTLLSLYFGPSPNSLVDPHASFERMKGKWIVAPVTNAVIYSSDRVKPELTRWINDVSQWDFTLISPSHFDARPGTPADLKSAFATTLESNAMDPTFDAKDFNLLADIQGVLKTLRII